MQEIIATLREIIVSIAPDAHEKAMYGGLVFELDYLQPKRLFCGVFERKDYVTIEFDRGTELHDPQQLLEGSGKGRRHLKINDLAEIESKGAADFIQQSFQLS